jgi:hypothetical protein
MSENKPLFKRLLKTLPLLMCCLFINLTHAQKCGTQSTDNKGDSSNVPSRRKLE